MADLALRIDRPLGRVRNHLIAAIGNGAHDEERQADPRSDLRHTMAFHVDSHCPGLRGQCALGMGGRDHDLAPGDRRGTRLETRPLERCGEPLAPGGLGPDAAAVRQQHGLRQEQIARRQVGC
jgi:hypothetical protein